MIILREIFFHRESLVIHPVKGIFSRIRSEDTTSIEACLTKGKFDERARGNIIVCPVERRLVLQHGGREEIRESIEDSEFDDASSCSVRKKIVPGIQNRRWQSEFLWKMALAGEWSPESSNGTRRHRKETLTHSKRLIYSREHR